MSRRTRVVLVALAAVAVAALYLSRDAETAPLDPDGTGPDGARALVLLLEEFADEVSVVDSVPLPEADVAVLLDDRLSAPARRRVSDWVRRGGTLVVADPASPFVPAVDDVDVETFGSIELARGTCDLVALDGVEALDVEGRVSYAVPAGSRSCFGSSGSAFVVAGDIEQGTVVALGGAGLWTNSQIERADNSVLAVALAAPTADTEVAVLRSDLEVPAEDRSEADGDDRGEVGGGSTNLFDLMPDYMRWVAVQLGAAWLVYAWARGRRLGRPVAEPQPVQIPGSEIVRATGRLLHRAPPAETAEILVEAARTDLCRDLGLAPEVDVDVIAAVAEQRLGIPATRVRNALGPPAVDDDAGLIRLSAIIDDLRRERPDVGTS